MQGTRTISGLMGAALLALVTATGLTSCVATPAGVAYVRMAPPPPEIEAFGVAPGGGYVWIAGHHAWRGNAYVWVPGHWERPPHEHARWIAGQWNHSEHGWYWIEGHWEKGS